MITQVIVEEKGREEIRARICWSDGAPDTVVCVKLTAYAHRMIAQFAEDLTPEEIAKRLNTMGLHTLRGDPWSGKAVKSTLYRAARRRALSRR